MSDHTKLAHLSRDEEVLQGAVNPPVHRASTILFERAEDLYSSKPKRSYGIVGMSVHDSLREAFCTLEQAYSVVLAPSGLAACTMPLLAICSAGDHVLLSNNIYGPTRRFCENHLPRLNIEFDFFDPENSNNILEHIKSNTKAIFMESPGSLTMELTDIPAIVAVAKGRNIWTLVDNTWGAGWFLKPITMGVDFSIQAASKYPCGHSDVLMGTIATGSKKADKVLQRFDTDSGNFVSPDDAWLVLRGLRTMSARLERQQTSALKVASWLSQHPKVAQVLHPALACHPDHQLWKRDFTGSSGLFSFLLHPTSEAQVFKILNSLKYFGLGFSWGGYESLAIHCDPQLIRTNPKWPDQGNIIRLSIGLEEPHDLIADLSQALNI
ncbi:MAG: cystathionine beta-lyase [Robiginitomaculum sp.]|nr:cystathionine beta-lyase [Robiginitomaculum sp.]